MRKVQPAEVCIPSKNLAGDLAFLTDRLGFRLDTIFPADDPMVAVISGHGVRIRLQRNKASRPTASVQRHALIVSRMRGGKARVTGRAGMQYRDLIPGRFGGALIASHIRIRKAGPVPDLVHFHTVGFQLIFCLRGSVKVVYEDQGPPFVLRPGDCVTQPPGIRHRVLESSANLEVLEVSAPAEHLTTMDQEMELPTRRRRPNRDFSGQRFCRSEAKDAVWTPGPVPGFEARETGVGNASGGLATVRVIRAKGSAHSDIGSETAGTRFGFVISGSMTLRDDLNREHQLRRGDAFVVPRRLRTTVIARSKNLRLLEVTFSQAFKKLAATGSGFETF